MYHFFFDQTIKCITIWSCFPYIKFLSGSIRRVQNRTNWKEKSQTKPIQTETAKNGIWFGCIKIIEASSIEVIT